MPAPLDVDREAVKAHAITHGLRAAAMAYGLPVSTVGSWSERDPDGPWCPKTIVAVEVKRPPTVMPRANSANTPSVAAKTQMQRLSNRSRLNIAKAVDKGAKHCSALKGEDILNSAKEIKALADTGDRIHQWSASSATPTLRLELIAGSQSNEPPVIDVESERL